MPESVIDNDLLENYFSSYSNDYFTGSQCVIYFGQDIWVDEVIRIGYDYQHEKIPIYGYASTSFDVVVEGRKLVVGRFAINYKEEAYLQLVFEYIKKTKEANLSQDAESALYKNINEVISLLKYQDQNASTDKDDTTKLGEQKILSLLYSSVNSLQDSDKLDSEFEKAALLLTSTIWNKGKSMESVGANSGDKLECPTNYGPFNIYMTFGDFDSKNSNHTAKKISEVYLTGQSMTVASDSEPLYEVYPFIAKGIDI